MDVLSIFEDKIKTDEKGNAAYAHKWDERAKRFYDAQKTGRKNLQESVVSMLKDKQIVTKDTTVLDIGAGAGRYTIPLAREAKHVLGTDFSQEMINYLNKVIKEESISNITTKQLAWPSKEPLETVDLVFSAMCPCTRSKEALIQMSELARKHGVIAQMTKMGDEITDELIKKDLVRLNPHDPHNNRDLAQSYFNILWELGFEPEVNFVIDEYHVELSFEEALKQYKTRYDHVEETTLEKILAKHVNDDLVSFKRTTRLGVISWSI